MIKKVRACIKMTEIFIVPLDDDISGGKTWKIYW